MAHHLLPIKHFHIIFTIPQELRDWFFYNQKNCYSLLFQTAWQTIQQIAGSGKTGMVATLHTWGSNLSFHPHVHCIVPAGAFFEDTWQYRNGNSNPRCFCDATQLRNIYKQIFLKNFLLLVEQEDFFFKSESIHSNSSLFEQLQKDLKQACRKEWTVRIENPVLGVEQLIAYLARYVRRVAITNSRIVSVNETNVVLNYKQYHLQKKGKPPPIGTIGFDGPNFIDRFAQHIPPAGFHKVRYYGCYAYSAKAVKAKCYTAITNQPPPVYKQPSTNQLVEALIGYDPDVCNHCGQIGNFVTIPLQKQSHLGFHLTKPYFIRSVRAGPEPVSSKYA